MFALLTINLVAFAADKDVDFKVNAPMLVSVGETFRVEFSLNDDPDKNSFNAPSFDGLEVLAGPQVSTGSSIQIINGSMSRSKETTYTYILVADSASTYTIGSASVVVDKKEYRTKPTPLEVVQERSSNQSSTNNRASSPATTAAGGASSQADAAARVASDDILLRMELSRRNPYQGEPVRATLKLYSRVAVVGSEDYKLPSYNGFWKQEIPSDNSTSTRETYNGKVYDVRVLSDNILYPQQSGVLTIEPASMIAIAQVVMQSRNGANPFFGGREVYNVRRKISTPEISIDVKSLPTGAPSSFSGAVGRFTIQSSISSDNITANSAANFNLRIAGEGNLAFIQAPKLNLPSSFDLYSVKSSEEIKTTRSAAVGYKQYEYPFIARSQGLFEIPAVNFSYFDPTQSRYVTLSTAAIPINVAADLTSNGDDSVPQMITSISREDVKLLGQDIRFIKLNSSPFATLSTPFILSRGYYITLFAIVLLFAVIYILSRRMMSNSQNSVLMRGKHANKVAIQRFKAAKGYMNSGNERAFYEEMHHALWGYMGDKLNISVAALTRESVRERLIKRGVTAELASKFSQIITHCDQAQYSPAASAQMGDIYIDAVDFISQIETQIKR